jgi:nitrogen-specific signal transduction histidine kinase
MMLEEMAPVLAHEIKNPLDPLRGGAVSCNGDRE